MRLRVKASGINATMGVLSSMLETDKMKEEIPWWLAVLFAAGVSIAAMFVPEEYEELAEALDGLSAGMANMAAGRVMEHKEQNRDDLYEAIISLKDEVAQLKAQQAP